jgi:hypothetical protein
MLLLFGNKWKPDTTLFYGVAVFLNCSQIERCATQRDSLGDYLVAALCRQLACQAAAPLGGPRQLNRDATQSLS